MFINHLVVNEHYYWYWMSMAWLAYLGYQRYATIHLNFRVAVAG